MNKKLNKYLICNFVFILQLKYQLTLQSEVTTLCETSECYDAVKKLKNAIDPTRNPCNDFFKFACGNFPKNYPNTADIANSTIQMRNYNNDQEILAFLKRNNSDKEPKIIHNLRKFFSLLVNESNFAKGLKPVNDILKRCDLLKEPLLYPTESRLFDLAKTLAKIHRITETPIFFRIEPAPHPFFRGLKTLTFKSPSSGIKLGIPPFIDPLKYFLNTSEILTTVLTTICKSMTSNACAAFTADSNKNTSQRFPEIDEYNRRWKQILLRSLLTGDESDTVMNLAKLQSLTDAQADKSVLGRSAFNWTMYLSTLYQDIDGVRLNFHDPKSISIAVDEDILLDIIDFFHSFPLHLHELKIRLKLIQEFGPLTDYDLAKSFGAEALTINGPTRELHCTKLILNLYGTALSYYYVENPYYNETKNKVDKMVLHIKGELRKMFISSTWLDRHTRMHVKSKLTVLKSLVGFPSYIENATNLESHFDHVSVTDNLLESVVNTARNKIKKNLRSLKSLNNLNWDSEDFLQFSPTTVDAAYSLTRNFIFIPAAILGSPIYEHSLKALMYGGVGTVIGHEITHGFDITGSQYNEIGQLEDWWQSQAYQKYQQKTKCFKNAYANYSEHFQNVTQNANGNNTLGEDMADNGGFKAALFAYRKYVQENGVEPLLPSFENYTHEQLFTLGFANLWCENALPKTTSTLLSDDHNPNSIRVNGVARNSAEFAKIWNCPKGSNMNPNAEKCELW